MALKFAPGDTLLTRLFNVMSGALCAGFCSPGLTAYFKVDSPSAQSAFSFGIGMFGLSLAAAVVTGLRDIKLADVMSSWLKRKE